MPIAVSLFGCLMVFNAVSILIAFSFSNKCVVVLVSPPSDAAKADETTKAAKKAANATEATIAPIPSLENYLKANHGMFKKMLEVYNSIRKYFVIPIESTLCSLARTMSYYDCMMFGQEH
ncbi:hypothetical protein EB796_004034 [Bugula neritina]|uniref:Uncharacterized protein n=1 Tax=Bugula neritina TaxID=10212 RepID=A0A7J7KG79_BUGNE|nr:hypothetical protein EB796_004034 [Bugula neritina]